MRRANKHIENSEKYFVIYKENQIPEDVKSWKWHKSLNFCMFENNLL